MKGFFPKINKQKLPDCTINVLTPNKIHWNY